MIVFCVTETDEKYRLNNYIKHKLAMEEAGRDYCLLLHYRQLTPAALRAIKPWAIIHSGSGTPYEDYDIRETRAYRGIVTRSPVPQLGICGGHQLIAEFFGSTVAPMRALGAADADHNPKYHPGEFKEWGVYPVQVVERDPLFRGLGAVIRVQQFHRSEVKTLGPGLVRLAGTADCAVQAFRHRHRPIYGVQFHPEEATDGYPDGRTILANFFRVARRR